MLIIHAVLRSAHPRTVEPHRRLRLRPVLPASLHLPSACIKTLFLSYRCLSRATATSFAIFRCKAYPSMISRHQQPCDSQCRPNQRPNPPLRHQTPRSEKTLPQQPPTPNPTTNLPRKSPNLTTTAPNNATHGNSQRKRQVKPSTMVLSMRISSSKRENMKFERWSRECNGVGRR